MNSTAILILTAKDLSPLARFVQINRRELAIFPGAYVPTQGVIQATWPSTKTLTRLFLAFLGLPRLPRRELRAELCDIEQQRYLGCREEGWDTYLSYVMYS